MTDAQQTARVLRNLAEENRKLRQQEKRLKKYLAEAMEMALDARDRYLVAINPATLTRWRKAL